MKSVLENTPTVERDKEQLRIKMQEESIQSGRCTSREDWDSVYGLKFGYVHTVVAGTGLLPQNFQPLIEKYLYAND